MKWRWTWVIDARCPLTVHSLGCHICSRAFSIAQQTPWEPHSYSLTSPEVLWPFRHHQGGQKVLWLAWIQEACRRLQGRRPELRPFQGYQHFLWWSEGIYHGQGHSRFLEECTQHCSRRKISRGFEGNYRGHVHPPQESQRGWLGVLQPQNWCIQQFLGVSNPFRYSHGWTARLLLHARDHNQVDGIYYWGVILVGTRE